MDNTCKMSITNTKGEVVDCDILFTFDSDDTNKSYIVYTDNTYDDSGKLKVYANIYDPYNDSGVLDNIDTKEEWDLIEGLFDNIKKEKE